MALFDIVANTPSDPKSGLPHGGPPLSSGTAPVNTTAPVSVRRLVAPGVPASLPRVRDLVSEAAEAGGFPPEVVLQLEMAVDEACTNVVEHAYKGQAGAHQIEVVVSQFGDRLEIVINDHSHVNFPVDVVPNVAPDEYLGSERKRGLGLYIINNFVDRVEHRFVGGQGNELRLTKFCA